MLRALQQSSSRVRGECCIPGAVCLGRREQEVLTQGFGDRAGARRGQGWQHVVMGWSRGCVGVAVPQHRVGLGLCSFSKGAGHRQNRE